MSSLSVNGIRYALSAYLIWGFVPIYFKQLEHIPALEITAHRVLWSAVFLLAVIAVGRDWHAFYRAFSSWRWLVLSTFFIATNWLVFVWAVSESKIIETSLGYFINPLVSVLLGRLFFAERLRRWQLVAVVLAVLGVLVQLIQYGRLPWVALVLASCFALYALVRKRADVPAVTGLAVETVLLLPFALAYWVWLEMADKSHFEFFLSADDYWLVGAGILTGATLLLFNAGVTKVPLNVLGLLQYVVPILSMLVAVLVYNEPFDSVRAISFILIWLALIVFSVDSWRAHSARYQQ